MSQPISTTNTQPGLVAGIVSCVCAALGFVIPVIGLITAIVGLVLGIRAYRDGKAFNYTPGLILGLIGSIVSGVSLGVAALMMLALFGAIGAGSMFAMSMF